MKQLDPKAVWLFFLGSFFQFAYTIILIAFFWFMFNAEDENTWSAALSNIGLYVVGILIVAAVLAFVWAKLTYHFYRYEITDAGFRKESGVIWKRYVTIPYTRIQNVDIYRGIIARILGLSDLHIQTAGASASMGRYGAMGVGSEGRLMGLSKADAEVLRDELINRARANTGQGV